MMCRLSRLLTARRNGFAMISGVGGGCRVGRARGVRLGRIAPHRGDANGRRHDNERIRIRIQELQPALCDQRQRDFQLLRSTPPDPIPAHLSTSKVLRACSTR